MPNITRPTGLTLRDWADQVVLDLDNYGAFGRLNRDSDWQNWAVQFLNNTTLGRNLPNPYQFTDWRRWAERLAQMLS
jgi:hypothetical protein